MWYVILYNRFKDNALIIFEELLAATNALRVDAADWHLQRGQKRCRLFMAHAARLQLESSAYLKVVEMLR